MSPKDPKRTLMIIAAQVVAEGVERMDQGRALVAVAKAIDDDGAERTVKKLVELGLVDEEGNLTPGKSLAGLN